MFEEVDFNKTQKIIISNPSNKDYKKVMVTKALVKGETVLKHELLTKTQSFVKNYSFDNICEALEADMEFFKQAEIWTSDYYYAFKITSKGKVLSNKKKLNTLIEAKAINKEKNYIIKEGMIIPALIDLGVMTADGKIVKSHYDKYRQINKYLEMLDSTIGYEDHLNIVDFGCGKSYLTFVVYYYLVNIRHIDVNIIGLDLKSGVIDICNKIRDKYGYKNLSFINKDIANFDEFDHIDLIMTLLACDVATDFALYHAIRLKCKYILSVPCCQKEINKQLDRSSFNLMNKYGLLKERFSALLTDSIRANILEYYGYRVNVGEFVDFDASPKNVLIKGVKTDSGKNEAIKKELDETIKKYGIHQTLYDLCFGKEND
ncbi:MAG: SAM-dependent methyltransferase [Acholeplasmatales bacterium]|nr:SAM-dependent methyltransferase [Acholeplasmatales bacterium]